MTINELYLISVKRASQIYRIDFDSFTVFLGYFGSFTGSKTGSK